MPVSRPVSLQLRGQFRCSKSWLHVAKTGRGRSGGFVPFRGVNLSAFGFPARSSSWRCFLGSFSSMPLSSNLVGSLGW